MPQRTCRAEPQCPGPLNQGAQRTCATYAVGQTCAVMLRVRYAVAVSEEKASVRVRFIVERLAD